MGGRKKNNEERERSTPAASRQSAAKTHDAVYAQKAGSMQNVCMNSFLAKGHTAPLYAKHCLVNSDTHGGLQKQKKRKQACC